MIFFGNLFILEEWDDFNNDNNQRMLYELNTFEEKLDYLYNNILNINAKSRGLFKFILKNTLKIFLEEAVRLLQELEFLNDRSNDLKNQYEGGYKLQL